MKWAEMEPQERDALVAERVMGLVPCQSKVHENGEMLPCHAKPESPTQGGETACYTSDIAATWQVVERMQERLRDEGCVHRFDLVFDPVDESWACDFMMQDRFTVYADTAPEAICLAALEACGVEVE